MCIVIKPVLHWSAFVKEKKICDQLQSTEPEYYVTCTRPKVATSRTVSFFLCVKFAPIDLCMHDLLVCIFLRW